MSEQDRFDWNDEDFESLADETKSPEDMDFESLEDESSMISDEAMEQELSEEHASAETSGEEVISENLSSRLEPEYLRDAGKGISSVALGFLFGFSTLAASLGLGGAMLYALGGNPLSLWDPSGLMHVDQWFNYQDHPLNILYIVGVSTVLLALMGSWAVARAVNKANRNLQVSEDLLGRICNLRLDNENAWQSPAFKKDATASSFVSETLGAWRLQQSRMKKYLGLEGELIRLQKAIQENQRVDISGPYKNYIAGSLSDEVARLFDERERALEEAGNAQTKDQHDSESIIAIIQDARSWNRSTLDKVGIQGATMDRVASHLEQLQSGLNQASDSSKEAAMLAEALVRLEAWKQAVQPKDSAGEMNSLLDRGNKLAFQIAMEVARLGTKGERLLPMTQALDELNTELRQASGGSASKDADSQWLQLQKQWDALNASLGNGGAPGLHKANAIAGELGPVSSLIGEQLADIARSFNQQGDRLTKLGEACSDLTGVNFDSASQDIGKADNPPEGGMLLNQFDPFGKEEIEEPLAAEVDPFSTGDISLPDNDGFERSGDFTSSVIPESEVPQISQEIEPELASEEERVYDLAEFGAVPLGEDSPVAADDAEDPIYDLSEFGAITMS